MLREQKNSIKSIILTALFAAIIYVGISALRIPLPALVGKPFIHFGNTLCAVGILLLGFRNGALAGIIGLGGFDILNGYASTSWLTMLEVLVVAAVLTGLRKVTKYSDSKEVIILLAIAAGVTKIGTSYCTGVVEALMAGTHLQPALTAAFFSLLATVINSVSTAICTPILYGAVAKVFRMRHEVQ